MRKTPLFVRQLRAEAAIHSQQLLFGTASLPQVDEKPGIALLGKRVVRCRASDDLRIIASPVAWEDYFRLRCQVESAYGLDVAATWPMIETMRERQTRLSIKWYFLNVKQENVAAVGLLEFDFNHAHCGRLQDVDVFPQYRRRGFGNRLLSAIEALAANCGVADLFVEARENDWPLQWYVRHGYERLAPT